MQGALPSSHRGRPLRILEVGAGIGTMIERLVERGAVSVASVSAIDSDPTNAAGAATRLQAWAVARQLRWSRIDESRWRVEGEGVDLDIHWKTASVFDEVGLPGDQDLVVAHAFLDLVDLDRALRRMLGALHPDGLFYFSLTYDGLSVFLPQLDLDEAILAAYHATMDRRRDEDGPAGGSRSGRHLLTAVRARGAQILDSGSSDWLVVPRATGYDPDERVFLHAIIDFVENALRDDPSIDGRALEAWLAARREQVEGGELIFLAHQIDVVGRVPG